MLEKILDIIELLAYEKGLQVDIVQNILKDEILKLAKNSIDSSRDFVVDFDKKEKNIKLFYKLKVLDDNDENLSDEGRFISLSEAKSISGNDGIVVGDELLSEVSMEGLSRGAIGAMLKDLESNIEKNIEAQIFDNLKNSVGKIVSGIVVSVDKKSEDTIIELDSIRAKLSRKNRIKGEKFQVGQSVSCILKSIYIDKKYGIQIELSRTTPKFLEELLTLEVPEISDGEISIIKCSRIPGVRAKVAVQSNTPRVDAVGATVGVRGVRINEVSKKICGESIDVIEYSSVFETFLANSLSPAKILSLKVESSEDEPKRATLSMYSDQKPKAIGKNGVNIRLASMLVGVELDIIDVGEDPNAKIFKDDDSQNVGEKVAESSLNNAESNGDLGVESKINESEKRDIKDIKESGKQLLDSLFKE